MSRVSVLSKSVHRCCRLSSEFVWRWFELCWLSRRFRIALAVFSSVMLAYVWEGRDLLQLSKGENGLELHLNVQIEPRSKHTVSRFKKKRTFK